MTDLPFLVPLVKSAWKVVEFVHIFKSESSFCFFIASITSSYLFPPKNDSSWPLSIVFVHQASVEMQEMALTVKFWGVTLGVKLVFVFSATFGVKGLWGWFVARELLE